MHANIFFLIFKEKLEKYENIYIVVVTRVLVGVLDSWERFQVRHEM
jgi:hypothetical protein